MSGVKKCPTVLAVIPARGGSKGLPRKNLLELNGKPLVAWSIEHCLNTPSIQETVVSTDSLDIRDVAIANGAQTPFIRPVNLSSDTASSIDVLLHCLDWYKEQDKCFDVVVMIEPTSPLREVSDIEKGLEKLFKIGEGSVVSVCESEGGHPSFSYVQSAESKLTPFTGVHPTNLRRQDIDPVYFLDGTFYASFVNDLYKYKSFYHEETHSIVVPKWKSLEIDDIYDFAMVEAVMKLKDEGFNSH